MKTGKRNRFAHRAFPIETGGFTTHTGASFVDDILSGDVQFKPLASVPEFEPEYLRDASGVAEIEAAETEGAETSGPSRGEDPSRTSTTRKARKSRWISRRYRAGKRARRESRRMS